VELRTPSRLRLRALVNVSAMLARIVPAVAAVLLLAAFMHGPASAAAAGAWTAFEERVRGGQNAAYTVTETARVAYFHPPDLTIDHVVRFVDPFLDFLDAEIMPVPQGARFNVLISPGRDEHANITDTLFGDRSKSIGTYYPRDNVLAMPAPVGPGTITSLLVYPVMNATIPHAPRWAEIAIATFFEKVFAYPGPDGKLVFRVGYQNPWRFFEMSGCLPRYDLAKIIGAPEYAGGTSHYRMLGTFLWQHGKLKPLIERLREKDRRGHTSYLSAAFDRPFEEVVPLWKSYLAAVDEQWYGIRNMPVSGLFASKDEFDARLLATEQRSGWRDWMMWRVLQPVLSPFCPIKDDRAVSLSPDALDLWGRAHASLQARRYHDALAEYDAVLKLAPDHADSHHGRATALWRTGDHAGAKAAFDRAVALDPRNANALFSRAYLRSELKDLAGAVEDYSRVITLDPKNVSAYANRGNAHTLLKNLDNALSDYNAALALNPDSVSVYRGRGWVYQIRRKFDLARADYEQGLKLRPTDEWLRNALAGLPAQQ
jgi:tetratricopeptide (TPR) repeat protein